LILALGSIGVYAILMSGWGSNSKYAFIGSLRAAAQMISYEVSLGLILITIILLCGSFDFFYINQTQSVTGWLIFPLLPISFLFFVSAIAETNRAPFDLTEGESELVSGYNLEFAGMTFALFFLAEYTHIIFMGFFFISLFCGGWNHGLSNSLIFCLKSSFVIMSFIWVRTSFPRFRYDQLMHLIWKSFLPFVLFYSIFVVSLLVL
jgi:NADH:ubiquinone oxidoreductase subunit H